MHIADLKERRVGVNFYSSYFIFLRRRDLLRMKKQLGVSVGVLLLLGGYTNISATEKLVYELNPVVVTATRTEKKLLDTPANTQVISQKQIRESGYTSAYEAVKNLSQAYSYGYQEDGDGYGGMVSRIRIRGIDSGTLVLVNGIPSNFKNTSSLGNIPADLIDRVEIVKGAGSALYGPQAIGGVINVITKKPVGNEKTTGAVYGSMGNRYKDIGFHVESDKIIAGYKKAYTGDLNDVARPGNTGTSGASVPFAIKDKSNQQGYITVSPFKDFNFGYSRTEYKSTYVAGQYLDYKPKIKSIGTFTTTMDGWNFLYRPENMGLRFAGSYDRKKILGEYGNTKDNNRYEGYNVNLDLQKTLSFNKRNDSLVIGAAFQREYWKATNRKYGVDGKENGRNSFSLYQSWDHRFSDRFNMIFGLREYWMNKSRYQKEDFQLLPQLQGNYRLNGNSSLYFNVGKSFEMPALDVGYYTKNIILTNDVNPQHGWTYELGYKYDGEKETFTANLFYMDIKDKWFYDKLPDPDDPTAFPGKYISVLKNSDEYHNKGLELSYKKVVNNNLDVYTGLTLQNPEIKTRKKKAWEQDAPKYIWIIGSGYHKDKFSANLNLFANMGRQKSYYKKDYKSVPGDHNLKSSFDLTMTLSYKPSAYDTIRLVGRNLLNQSYPMNDLEYRNTPINYYLTYERKF